MREIIVTTHAAQRMKERKVAPEAVHTTVSNVHDSLMGILRIHSTRYKMTVVIEAGKVLKIITVTELQKSHKNWNSECK